MDELTLPYDILRFDYKERLDDRFLTTHLHRFEMFNQPVAIAIVIEILNPWHPTSELGQKIMNNIVREFLRRDAQSFLTRFESSLKHVNKTVEEALGKLNTDVGCVAVLLEADQVHCAGIGTAKLGLQRNGKLSTIVGGHSPLRTFSSVTSGDLRQGDWLCLANQDFYTQIETVELTAWQDNDPLKVTDELVSCHARTSGDRQAGLLLRFNQATEPINQTTFWEESGQASHRQIPQVNLSGLSDKLSAFPKTYLLPAGAGISRVAGQLVSKIRQLLAKMRRSSPATTDPAQPKELSERPTMSARARTILPLVILAVVILTIGALVYRRIHRQVVVSKDAQTLASQVDALAPEAILKGLLDKFSAANYQSLSDADKQALATHLAGSQITIIDLPAATAEAPNPIVALDVLNGEPILADSLGQVWLYKNALLNKIDQKQPIPSPISLTALAESNIVVSDATGNLWQLNGTADAPIALTQPKVLPTNPKVVSSYKANLYIAVTDLKVTFRIVNFTADLASASIYNKGSDLTLAAINDLAINGALLAVDNSGQVRSFAKSKLGTISASLPANDGAFHIAASDKSPQIAVGSGRLLYLLDPAGTLQKTLFLNTDAKITDLAFDPATPNTLWITLGTQLYKLPLP